MSKLKYVSLHNHTGYSSGDGMGLPSAHLDSAFAAGNSAHAITDHGNASSLANSYLHSLKMKKEGKDFKYIKGVEAYFIPSVQEWKELKAKLKVEAEENKKKVNDEEDVIAAEDENESKSKQKNPLIKRSHLVLLAQNELGHKNICRLVTRSQSGDNFYVKPRMDFELLRNNSEGLICTSACVGSVLNSFTSFWEGDYKKTKEQQKELIKKFQSIFGDRFFLELQFNMIPEQHVYNDLLIQLSDELSIPLTVASDCHYPKKELWKDREIYRQIAMLSQKKEFEPIPDTLEEMRYELYPKNGDEMYEYALRTSRECGANYDESLIRDAISRTQFISDTMIEDYKIDTEIRFPTFANAPGKTGAETLREMAFAKLREKGLDNSQYSERLDYELNVVDGRNMSEYFLLTKEIVNTAEKTMTCGLGRGSASGCLISYLIGLTKIDPIKYGLQFERFLMPDSKDLPDIDTDFEDTAALKETLQKEWKEKYNVDVVPITNYNRLQLRALIKDLSKMEGVDFQEVNNVTSKMVFEAMGPAKKKNNIESGAYNPTYEETLEFSPTLRDFLSKYPKIALHIANIQGEIRNASVHAAGVVVGENIEDRLPLISRGGKAQTPFQEGIASRELEPMGFQKMDLLGLATLRTIHYCISSLLKEQNGQEPTFEEVKLWYDQNLHPDAIDFDNLEVYENVFGKKKFPGIFQFTQKGAQDFAHQASPKCLNDLSNITAIFRPGTLAIGMDKTYVDLLANPENIKYDHECLKDVLKDTYGLVIYQESIASVAHALGKDLSLAEGNKLRKLLIKKGTGDHTETLAKIKEKFVNGCKDKGLKDVRTNKIWSDFMQHVNYSFNKCLEGTTIVEVRGKGKTQIKDVKIGDWVLSRNGYVEVLNVFEQGKKQVFEVQTNSGSWVLSTLDHKFDSPIGTKPLLEILQVGESVYCKNSQAYEGIRQISPWGLFETYDLEVNHPDHTFFANGISVSNSHSISYAAISFQCAHLFTYHEKHWLAAVLDKEPEDKKSEAIRIVQDLGYEVLKPDINVSELNWIPVNDKQLVQPLLSIKGCGEKAIEQIMLNKPFNTIEEFLFSKNVIYGKLNKGAIDKLVRARALDCLMDNRFKNLRHFWECIASHRPKNEKELEKNIKEFENVEEFTNDEQVEHLTSLTGVFPFERILNNRMIAKLRKLEIAPISEHNAETNLCYFIPRVLTVKTSKNNKQYAIIDCIDDRNVSSQIKCWNFDPNKDRLTLNHCFIGKLEYSQDWGISTRRMSDFRDLNVGQ